MADSPFDDLLHRLHEQLGGAAAPLIAALEPLLDHLDVAPKAEVERLAAELKDLRATVAKLEAELDTLSKP